MVHDLGLLTSRAAIGLAMAAHGAQKTHGTFEGPGPEGTTQMMSSLGFEPADRFASIASYNELISGLALALGIGGPLAPAGIISGMLVAAMTVHAKNGFFTAKNGVEVPVLYAAAALAIASAGYGALSLDHATGLDKKFRHPVVTALALAGAFAGGFMALSQRRAPAPAQPAA
jgi:putative oxidoreductase